VYRFLSSDVRAYLPSYESVTVWFLRDLCSGKRKIVKCDAVKVIQLPHYEGLNLEEIIYWAKGHQNGVALKALPEDKKEMLKLPRSYIANVIYTQVGQPFQDWANKRIKERNEKIVQDRDMTINMDPEVAAIFRSSTAVSGKYIIS